MLLTRPKSAKSAPPPRGGGGGPLSSRGGTLVIAAMLSLLAGAALLVFLRQYREDLTGADRARVVVAAQLVPKGTTGEVLLERRMYRIARVKEDDVKDGAVIDPSDLSGQTAARDLFPGHALTRDDFEDADSTVGSRLTKYQRAMTVPVDRAHGMVGKIHEGDRVDVITTGNSGGGVLSVATVAARGALVLAVPDGDGSGVAGRKEQITIRVQDNAAGTIAAAADEGEIWLVLRPAVGARSHGTDASISGVRNGEPFNADVDISARVRER
jgi:Flp pilus assembly protein CpaB